MVDPFSAVSTCRETFVIALLCSELNQLAPWQFPWDPQVNPLVTYNLVIIIFFYFAYAFCMHPRTELAAELIAVCHLKGLFATKGPLVVS